MPVAIVGMHRSGTSLLAQMLDRSGLYLGSEDRLLGPGSDNPEGFWEHTGFQRLNDAVLAELGGGWEAPPAVPASWVDNPRLAAHLGDVRQLLEEFSGREPWGWKDPRTSLTLTLWLELIPDLKVILCLRNPLEVAFSLQRRNGFSYSEAIRLWQLYNERALQAPAAERLVVSYERVLSDGEAELARVLRFVGISAGTGGLRAAAKVRRDDLRHGRFGTADLNAVHCCSEVVELYERLQAGAGIGYHDTGPASQSDGSDRVVDELALAALVALQQVEAAPDDSEQIARIKLLVRDATPPGSTLAVISKGDERLVDLHGRNALHFPHDDEGAPLGYHPSSGRSAVAQLELARVRGADFLMIPATSMWWLEHYRELRLHLHARYRPSRWDAETAVLFDLREPLELSGRPRTHGYTRRATWHGGAPGAHDRGEHAH